MAKGEVTGFVDESIRGQRYLISCVLIETRNLSDIRVRMKEIAGTGRRIHFHQESDRVRIQILDVISHLPIDAFVIEIQLRHGINVRMAREKCISFLVKHLQSNDLATRIVLEDFSDYQSDIRIIQSARSSAHRLAFEHRDGNSCPELWIADAVVWTSGLSPKWKQRINPIVNTHFIIT